MAVKTVFCDEVHERNQMPRKPNYRFERSQRNKSKAEKKAERLEAKTRKSDARKAAREGRDMDQADPEN